MLLQHPTFKVKGVYNYYIRIFLTMMTYYISLYTAHGLSMTSQPLYTSQYQSDYGHLPIIHMVYYSGCIKKTPCT